MSFPASPRSLDPGQPSHRQESMSMPATSQYCQENPSYYKASDSHKKKYDSQDAVHIHSAPINKRILRFPGVIPNLIFLSEPENPVIGPPGISHIPLSIHVILVFRLCRLCSSPGCRSRIQQPAGSTSLTGYDFVQSGSAVQESHNGKGCRYNPYCYHTFSS